MPLGCAPWRHPPTLASKVVMTAWVRRQLPTADCVTPSVGSIGERLSHPTISKRPAIDAVNFVTRRVRSMAALPFPAAAGAFPSVRRCGTAAHNVPNVHTCDRVAARLLTSGYRWLSSAGGESPEETCGTQGGVYS